jgi:uncharacterized membrane protein YoaK (UPF0700 family)
MKVAPASGNPIEDASKGGTYTNKRPASLIVKNRGSLTSAGVSDIEQAVKVKAGYKAPTIAIELAGVMLSGCAGCVNVVCFLRLGTFVSHVSGTSSKVGMQINGAIEGTAYESILLVFSFILGSIACGCLIARRAVQIGKALYGMALMSNSSLLVLTVLLNDYRIAPYLAAAACGLQNGMATSYSGAVIRTTHMTGLATDIGLLIAKLFSRCIRKRCWKSQLNAVDHAEMEIEAMKLRLLSLLLLGFLAGSLIGALLSGSIGINALLVPAAVTGVAGLMYCSLRVICLKQGILQGAAEPDSPVSPGANRSNRDRRPPLPGSMRSNMTQLRNFNLVNSPTPADVTLNTDCTTACSPQEVVQNTSEDERRIDTLLCNHAVFYTDLVRCVSYDVELDTENTITCSPKEVEPNPIEDERRIDPLLCNRAVSYKEMSVELATELATLKVELTEAQLKQHWNQLSIQPACRLSLATVQ